MKFLSFVLQRLLSRKEVLIAAMRFFRTRPGLISSAAVGGVVLWLFVEFQQTPPGAADIPFDDPVFVTEQTGSDEDDVIATIETLRGGLPSTTDSSDVSVEQRLRSRLQRGHILTDRRERDDSLAVPSLTVPSPTLDRDLAEEPTKRAAWLIGTIEEINQYQPTTRTADSRRYYPSRR